MAINCVSARDAQTCVTGTWGHRVAAVAVRGQLTVNDKPKNV